MKNLLLVLPWLWCAAMPALAADPIPPGAVAPAPKLPPLTLTKQFAGPLANTAIQRFIDPDTGVVCYLYTPYVVRNAKDQNGQVVYDANNIGNISCVAPWKNGGQK